ncbi:MAG TPA: glycosyltransferase family 9 protein [Bacillota bacterium]|jgi:ADP-heptose:LPS heptosyltransferase|nr:glycosyltransferase family 9 protein [Bacillota bacterium]HOL08706.1 glycosyltransferase family 9 protein [Bacillota bacterium]HPO96391.1 glycosyltransferase family 9 protein [Bacillota bacterium]
MTIKNVLAIRQSGIGDILFTLPAINVIKSNYPDCKITYLTKKRFAVILKGFSAVDEVIAIDSDIFHSKNIGLAIKYSKELLSRLKAGEFDLVVDFHGQTKTALFAWLTGTKERWGIIKSNCSKPFYRHKLEVSRDLHRIDLNLKLLSLAGLNCQNITNSFILPDEELQRGLKLFNQWGLSTEKPTIFIQPFTNYEYKNWPLEKFFELAKYWDNQGIQILFGGGPGDQAKLEQIADHFPVAAGQAGLLTTGALMQLSTLIIGGDTGMLHLAVALGKRVIMLMNTINQTMFYPYGHPEWVITPENTGSLADVDLSKVIEAIDGFLRENCHD